MKTLREAISEAVTKKVAIGHFNISNIEGFWGVVTAAKKLNVPVIIGVSEGERDFIGVGEVKALVESYRKKTGQEVYLNADHTYSFDRVKEVVDYGYDAAIFDGTELSFEENVLTTKRVREYMEKKNPGMILEAEIGFIGKSSKVLDSIPEGVKIGEEFLTKPEDAVRFVKETGVDLLAPAVGNIHGMLKGGKDPALNIQRIQEIHNAVTIPLVLHGGSGNSEEDFKAAIKAGVAIIHVNTEIRVAFKDATKRAFQEYPDEVAPYKLMKPVVLAIEKVVEEKLKICNNL